jgi:hypothetical protein
MITQSTMFKGPRYILLYCTLTEIWWLRLPLWKRTGQGSNPAFLY